MNDYEVILETHFGRESIEMCGYEDKKEMWSDFYEIYPNLTDNIIDVIEK